MAAAMDRNPQITVNAPDETIGHLLNPITTTNLESAIAHLKAKHEILKTIPAFMSINKDTGHPITSVDDKAKPVPGSERSLEAFVLEQITLVQEEKSVNPTNAIQKADQFIRSMALTQRVRDIETETNLHKVLEYLLSQITTLKTHAEEITTKLDGNITDTQLPIAEENISKIMALRQNAIRLYSDIGAQQKEIEKKSIESSNLFAITEGTKPDEIEVNQARGAGMVPGIQALIDGEGGLRAQCMNALQFVVHEFPAAVKEINTNLAPLFPKDTDEDNGAAAVVPTTQIEIEAFDTDGMNTDLIASLTPAQRVAKLAELAERRDGISKTISDLESALQTLFNAIEDTRDQVAATTSTRDEVVADIRVAEAQAKAQASPAKHTAKFKTSHDKDKLTAQKTDLEAREAALREHWTSLEKQLEELLGLQSSAEADLAAVLQQITELNSAFDDSLAAYKDAQKDYSEIAADLNAQDAEVKAILEESEAQKAALPEKLEGAKATAKAMHDAAKATFIKGQAENVDAKLKELAAKINSNWVEGSAKFAHDSKEHQDLMTKIATEINPPLMVEAQQLVAQRTHDRAEAFAQIEAEYAQKNAELDEKNERENKALDEQIARLHETENTIRANLEAYKTPVNEAYAALEKIAAIAGRDIGEIEYIVDFVAAMPAAAAAAAPAVDEDAAGTKAVDWTVNLEDGSSTEEEEEGDAIPVADEAEDEAPVADEAEDEAPVADEAEDEAPVADEAGAPAPAVDHAVPVAGNTVETNYDDFG